MAATLSCATALASVTHAQTPPPSFRASGRVETYRDTDATEVVRPRVSVEGALSDRWRASGTYMADVVTSASIDVVTRATQAVHEVRHEAMASASHGTPATGLTTLGYTLGREPDYQSNAGSVTHARNLDEARLWYLVVQSSVAHGRVGTVADQSFERSMWSTNASASITRVLSATSLVRVGLELSNVHGFQSSAYRTVRIGDWSAYRYAGDDPDAGAWVFVGVTETVRERHPTERLRGRIAFDFLHALGDHFALALNGAVYADSWQMRAAEIGPELRWEPATAWLFRLGARTYAQSSTWFFRRRYENTTETRGYLTDDKELGPMRTYTIHVAAQVPMGPVRFDARVEGNFYRYPELSLLHHKEALVFTLGMTYRR